MAMNRALHRSLPLKFKFQLTTVAPAAKDVVLIRPRSKLQRAVYITPLKEKEEKGKEGSDKSPRGEERELLTSTVNYVMSYINIMLALTR